MAATANAVLSLSGWMSAKPDDYKGGKDFESALKECDATLNSRVMNKGETISELEAKLSHLKKISACLKAVRAAATKTASDLKKAAKDAKDKADYESAASFAEACGREADRVRSSKID